jgi:hypothetical protein
MGAGMRDKIYLASAIGAVLAIADTIRRFADMDWSGRPPLVAALACLLFCLICIRIGAELLFPPSEPKRRPSLRQALQKRRIGGTNFTLDERLTIDCEGVFESRLGMIAWSQIVAMSKVTFDAQGVSIPLLRLCVRDPWRYLESSSRLQEFMYRATVSRDARYGWIDIATARYRVDLETAYEIALGWRNECPDPFIDQWTPFMSDDAIESRLSQSRREREPMLQLQAHRYPAPDLRTPELRTGLATTGETNEPPPST